MAVDEAKTPPGWQTRSIGEIADVVGGGTPARTVPAYWGGSIPWVTPTEVTQSSSKYIWESPHHITENGLRNSSARLLPAGTVLMTSRASVGFAVIAGVEIATNQGFQSLVCKDGYDNSFIYHLIPSLRSRLEQEATGTTFLEISGSKVRQLQVCLPPTNEQRAIAAILDAADEAIAKTEALIAKLKAIKQGLLHDLLTRGLDDNGELRDPEKHPEQFKETPLGQIPGQWDVVALATTALPGASNFVDGDWIETPFITDHGIRLIQTGNIGIGAFIDKPDTRRFISEKSFKDLGCRWVYPGDLLICRLADPIGRLCQVPDWIGECVTAVDCTIFRPDPKRLHSQFAVFAYNTQDHLARVGLVAAGSTRQRISRINLGKVPVILPPVAEQHRIANVLSAQAQRIEAEQQFLSKLKAIKKGLMQDLLTGRVRVPAEKIAALSTG